MRIVRPVATLTLTALLIGCCATDERGQPVSKQTQASVVESWLLRPPWGDNPWFRGVPTRADQEPFAWEPWFEEGRGTPGAVPGLVEILKKESNLDEPAEITERAVYALGWIGDDRAIDALTHLLETKYTPLRSEVIASLGRLKATAHFERFRDYALDDDEDQNIRGNAIIALGNLRHPKSAEVLEQLELGSSFLTLCVQEGLSLLERN